MVHRSDRAIPSFYFSDFISIVFFFFFPICLSILDTLVSYCFLTLSTNSNLAFPLRSLLTALYHSELSCLPSTPNLLYLFYFVFFQ